MITYTNKVSNITVDILNGFFVGWPNPPSPSTHLKLLRNSTYVWLAICDARVVGFITAVSDSVLCAYIPFLEVLPEYQGQGIGSELVRRMKDTLVDFYMVDLLCDEDKVSFYERFGMVCGTGMMLRNRDKLIHS